MNLTDLEKENILEKYEENQLKDNKKIIKGIEILGIRIF